MKRTFAIIAVLGIVAAACGSSVGTVDSPRTVEVDAQEFAFDPESIDITPGETVEFVITNTGAVTHEFVVTNQEEIDEHLEAGHEGHDEGEMSEEDMADMDGMAAEGMIEVEVEPGETETLTVTFDDTDHLARFVCLIEGHYEAGMTGDFSFDG